MRCEIGSPRTFIGTIFSGLTAAVAVAIARPVDVKAIRAWAQRDYANDRSGDQINKTEEFVKSVERQKGRT